ncbi:MAG: SpoIVB peptidase [Clostridia bacterium]|nr:SpoIVB peptidase [Clostridia bacterium]
MKEEQHNLPWTAQLLFAVRALVLCLTAAFIIYALSVPAWAAGVVKHEEAVETATYSAQRRMVVPMGRAVGIKLFSDGVMVVGLSEIAGDGGATAPAKTCGLKQGDIITHINEKEVDTIEEVQAVLQELSGDQMSIRAIRGEKEVQFTAQAVKCSADGSYKLGAWIRDSMAGIGTMTFYDPATGQFGALGHGINDVDTSLLMPLESGSIMYASVADVKKGIPGTPGELHGSFQLDRDMGELYANTAGGVFGTLTDESLIKGLNAMPVALRSEVKTGAATILSNIAGDSIREYAVEITRIYPGGSNETRDLMVKVTDPELLAATGGIVQGMSGSPILQNGRLVGAVTHVLVNDPTSGYGILAEHMLGEAAEETQGKLA